jgi:hypothetical protein
MDKIAARSAAVPGRARSGKIDVAGLAGLVVVDARRGAPDQLPVRVDVVGQLARQQARMGHPGFEQA